MADIDLPVFPFRVNWRNGLTERLAWNTDVLTGLTGNEQRRGLRLTPRREYEATVTVHDIERSFFDLWLHRMIGTDMLVPLWHDSVRTSAGAATAATEVFVDTRGLEFTDGSLGLLRGLTALSFEVIEIATVEDNKLVLSAPLTGTWPKGTRVEPLRRGRMTDQTQLKNVTSSVAEGQAAFELIGAQPYDEGVWPGDLFMGMPVITEGPNRSESVDQEFQWAFNTSDSESGARYRKSDVGRAMVNQKHSWLLRGRDRKVAFRQFMYQCKGQLNPVWLPTFNDDFFPAQPVVAASASLYVRATGFAYTGGPSSGREYIQIVTRTGILYRRITGTAAAPAGQERLLVTPPFPAALSVADIRRVSFMDTMRFQNDIVEFNHVNAADGATTVAGIMQAFRDEREPPAILSLPIPEAAMSAIQCGDPPASVEVDPCRPATPCPPYPVKLQFAIGPGCDANRQGFFVFKTPQWNLPGTPNYHPNPPMFVTNDDHPEGFMSEGKEIGIIYTHGSAGTIYEKDTRDTQWYDPRLVGQILFEMVSGIPGGLIIFHFPVPAGRWSCSVQYGFNYCADPIRVDWIVTMCRTGGRPPNCSCDMTECVRQSIGGEVFGYDREWIF